MNNEFKHTYLLQPGLWEISGVYFDARNNPMNQKGQLIVTHEPDLWTIEGQVTVAAQETQTIHSRYDIDPLGPGATFTEWKSEAGGPEPVFGLFVMVAETIMSPWQSKSGTYWGQEILFQVSPTEYRGRGFAFLKNEKVAAWATELFLR